jgi:osmotically-inducible protein OsmY
LQRLPQLSVLGSDEPAASSSPSAELNENEWRSESRALRNELNSLRQNKAAADAACRKAREKSMINVVKPRRGTVTIVDLSEEPADCERARKIAQQLQTAQEQYDDLEDRARMAGVPWQWLD